MHLLKASLIYTISNTLNAAVPFFLLPILSSYLSRDQYGMLSNFQIFLALIIPIVSLNSDSALARRYYEKDNGNIKPYLNAVSTFSLTISILLYGLTYVFDLFIHCVLQIEWFYIRLGLTIVYVRVLINLSLNYFQASKQPFSFSGLSLSYTVLNILLTLMFLSGLNTGWQSRIYGQLVASIAVFFWFYIFFLKREFNPLQTSRSELKYLLSFGLPLLPQAFFSAAVIAIDRFMLTGFLGSDVNGVFSLSFQLASILSFFTISLNSAFVPWFYGKLNSGRVRDKLEVVKMTFKGWAIIIIAGIAVLLLIPFIFDWFVDDKFEESLRYIPVLILGFVFQGFYFSVSNYLTYLKSTRVLGKIAVFIILLKLPLSYVLIRQLGVVGACYSFSITYLIYFVWVYRESNRRLSMPWNIRVF